MAISIMAEHCYAECHYAERRHAECHGDFDPSPKQTFKFLLNPFKVFKSF